MESYKPLRETMKSHEAILAEFDETGKVYTTPTHLRILLEAILDVRDMFMGYMDGMNEPDEKEN